MKIDGAYNIAKQYFSSTNFYRIYESDNDWIFVLKNDKDADTKYSAIRINGSSARVDALSYPFKKRLGKEYNLLYKQ